MIKEARRAVEKLGAVSVRNPLLPDDERALKSVVEYLNGENMVWNSDYPHPDAPEPAEALPDLDAQAIPEGAKRKILWDNAVKLYGRRILSTV
jgi:predicted TIM-barrel fold metal-dependent hydrolase